MFVLFFDRDFRLCLANLNLETEATRFLNFTSSVLVFSIFSLIVLIDDADEINGDVVLEEIGDDSESEEECNDDDGDDNDNDDDSDNDGDTNGDDEGEGDSEEDEDDSDDCGADAGRYC